jgi:hypothetical protein
MHVLNHRKQRLRLDDISIKSAARLREAPSLTRVSHNRSPS